LSAAFCLLMPPPGKPWTWEDFYRWLLAAERSIPQSADQWPLAANSRVDEMSLRWQLENDELNHAYEIDRAIDCWLQRNLWPEQLTPKIRFYLWLRLDTAARLTLRIGGGPRSGPSPIDPPNRPATEVARWLLIDWWETHGRSSAVHAWIRQQWNRSDETGL
jgi:hypothetical protein